MKRSLNIYTKVNGPINIIRLFNNAGATDPNATRKTITLFANPIVTADTPTSICKETTSVDIDQLFYDEFVDITNNEKFKLDFFDITDYTALDKDSIALPSTTRPKPIRNYNGVKLGNNPDELDQLQPSPTQHCNINYFNDVVYLTSTLFFNGKMPNQIENKIIVNEGIKSIRYHNIKLPTITTNDGIKDVFGESVITKGFEDNDQNLQVFEHIVTQELNPILTQIDLKKPTKSFQAAYTFTPLASIIDVFKMVYLNLIYIKRIITKGYITNCLINSSYYNCTFIIYVLVRYFGWSMTHISYVNGKMLEQIESINTWASDASANDVNRLLCEYEKGGVRNMLCCDYSLFPGKFK